ncbi:flagellar hook assembly protein FlgD [Clostridium sp. BJN0013]|uniref:flagellar hook assembly protein FlgD n=1 Tax=Clostridium sp. BJN0013 TaxID=3236840 RepID=UPI0034C66AD9
MSMTLDNVLNQSYSQAFRTFAANTSTQDTEKTSDDNDTSDDTQKYYPISSDESSNTTENGTKIVNKKTGYDMDLNMFLKILCAELENQDPTDSSSQGSTEYISQLAQFSALQQMMNLNNTNRISTANSLVNKYVTLSDRDSEGNYVTGQVVGVVKDGDDVQLKVIVGTKTDSDGNTSYDTQNFSVDNLIQVDDLGDAYNITTNNMMLLSATSLIGKQVETSQKDDSGNYYSGIVQSVSRGTGGIIVKVQISEGETKDFYFDQISKVKDS